MYPRYAAKFVSPLVSRNENGPTTPRRPLGMGHNRTDSPSTSLTYGSSMKRKMPDEVPDSDEEADYNASVSNEIENEFMEDDPMARI